MVKICVVLILLQYCIGNLISHEIHNIEVLILKFVLLN